MSDSQRWLVSAAILGGLNAIAIVVAISLMAPAGTTDGGLAFDADEGALRDLARAAETIAERLESLPASPAADREMPRRVVTPTSNDGAAATSPDVTEALDRLASAVEQLAASSVGSRGPAADLRGGLRMADANAAAKNLAELEALESSTAVSQRHHFWSMDQVIERYGQPSSMSLGQSGDLRVNFRDPASGKRYEFRFLNGFVYYVRRR